tara:strand:+ start:302 stop:463 length:162 start_codon:yes stop_codon:yes gene_type:complete
MIYTTKQLEAILFLTLNKIDQLNKTPNLSEDQIDKLEELKELFYTTKKLESGL